MRTTVAPAPHVRRVGFATTIVSMGVIMGATLLPESNPPLASHWCLVCGSQGGVDSFLNILLFVPLGCGLALAGVRARYALLVMFAFSAVIECSQLVLIAGRDATLGDVVTNTIGGALGFAIGQRFGTLLRPSFKAAAALALSWSVVWLALQTVASFGFALAIPSSTYYGQIDRRLGNFELYRGRVLKASIGPISIPDHTLEDSPALKGELDATALVTITVVPDGPTFRIAPIVRIVDARQNEVALIGQYRTDAIFAVRTGASALHLRAPVFGLSKAFEMPGPAVRGGDTVALSARYSPAVEVYMGAKPEHQTRARLSPSLGWTLLGPGQWLIEGTTGETALRTLWVACLLLPLGYWLGRATRASAWPERAGVFATIWCAAVLWFGTMVIPKMFGVGPATALDWASALIGLLVGASLERLTLGDPDEA